MTEPITEFILEAPGGLVPVKAYCEDGKAKSIEVNNVASFADQLDINIDKTDGLKYLQESYSEYTKDVILTEEHSEAEV